MSSSIRRSGPQFSKEGGGAPEEFRIARIFMRPGVKFEKEALALGLKVYPSWRMIFVSDPERKRDFVEIMHDNESYWVKKDDLADCVARYALGTKNLGDPENVRTSFGKPTKDIDQAAVGKYKILKEMLDVDVMMKLAQKEAIQHRAEQFAEEQVKKRLEGPEKDERALKDIATRITGDRKGVKESIAGFREQRMEAGGLSTLEKIKQEKIRDLEAVQNRFNELFKKQQLAKTWPFSKKKGPKLTDNERIEGEKLAKVLVDERIVVDPKRYKKLTQEQQEQYNILMDEAIREYCKGPGQEQTERILAELDAHPKAYERIVEGEKAVVKRLLENAFRQNNDVLHNKNTLADFFKTLAEPEKAPSFQKAAVAAAPKAKVSERFEKALESQARKMTEEALEEDREYQELAKANDLLLKKFSKPEIQKIATVVQTHAKAYKGGNPPKLVFPDIGKKSLPFSSNEARDFMMGLWAQEVMRQEKFKEFYAELQVAPEKEVKGKAEKAVAMKEADEKQERKGEPTAASQMDTKHHAASKVGVSKPKEVEVKAKEEEILPDYSPSAWKKLLGEMERIIHSPYVTKKEKTKAFEKLLEQGKTLWSQAKQFVAKGPVGLSEEFTESGYAWKEKEVQERNRPSTYLLDLADQDVDDFRAFIKEDNINSVYLEDMMKRHIKGYEDVQFIRQFVNAKKSGAKIWHDTTFNTYQVASKKPKGETWVEAPEKQVEKRLKKVLENLKSGDIDILDEDLRQDFEHYTKNLRK